MVCSTVPPSATRAHHWLGTSAYQTAPPASRQMPSRGAFAEISPDPSVRQLAVRGDGEGHELVPVGVRDDESPPPSPFASCAGTAGRVTSTRPGPDRLDMLGFPSGLVVLEIGLMILLASPMAMPRRRRRVVHRPVDVLRGTGPDPQDRAMSARSAADAGGHGSGWRWRSAAREVEPRSGCPRSPAKAPDDQVVEPEPARAGHGENEAEQAERDDQLGTVVVHGEQAAGVHEDPRARHVQRHQDADDRYRDAEDHRDATDELEEHVGRPGDRGQRDACLLEELPDPGQAAAEVVRPAAAFGGASAILPPGGWGSGFCDVAGRWEYRAAAIDLFLRPGSRCAPV